MKTKIIKIKGDWNEVLNDCRSTVGKAPLGKEPSTDFKKKILIAEHSPIRDISFKWTWGNIKSFIATHYSRHKWECFIKTQRTDRAGVSRDELPQSAKVSFTGEANVQHFIDTARKRLCYQADPETRHYMEDLKLAISEADPQIAEVLVPNCIYRGDGVCPEMQSCGFAEKFKEKYGAFDSIQQRYEAYNTDFYGRVKNDN